MDEKVLKKFNSITVVILYSTVVILFLNEGSNEVSKIIMFLSSTFFVTLYFMIHYPFKKITTVFTILLIFCFVFGIRYASQRLSLEKEELEKEREKLQKEMNFNN